MNPADRNLLFGILAVQLNFVGRDALIAAMHAWVLERSSTLGRILVEQQALSPARHDLLEQLVDEHLAAHGGDAEKSLAATDGIGAIRDELERVADPEIRATLNRVPDTAAATQRDREATLTYSADAAAPAGSRYTILRPHARGGLGQVSVARDQELNREVALKELRPERADDPGSRSRFLLEAEVTGRLEHPGVVPVYGLGSDAQGRPYYAMRFVKGQNLKEATDRLHEAEKSHDGDPRRWNLALRQLLNRFVAVCNVMAYAHSRGVIHRDLKPANILLGPYGETLVVDWGLAKVVGRSEAASKDGAAEATLQPGSGSGSSETLPGTALGTPAYMSPEQAEGRLDQVGPLSDVYSLGATLYCLLTGKPPLDETDVGEALRRVLRGEFPPPRAVRPSIPQGLEAICLKAVALKPEERYPSARALADEIEHWLADEPIAVYRDPIATRLTRWGRRHKAAAVGIGALLVASVVGLSVGTALIGREQGRTAAKAEELRAKAEELRREGYVDRVNRAFREAEAGNISLSESLLDECPQVLRGWEWAYVKRLGHRDRRTYLGHSPTRGVPGLAVSPETRGVLCLAASPDGTWIASGAGTAFAYARSDEVAEVRLWEVETGRDRKILRGLPGTVQCVAISPDGTLLAAGGGYYRPEARGWLTLWDLKSPAFAETGRPRWTKDAEEGMTVLSVAFAPDGQSLAAGSGLYSALSPGRWDLRDVASGTGLKGDRVRLGGVDGLAFHPERPLIALACWERVELWDWKDGVRVGELSGHARNVKGVAISRDGARLASGANDSTIRIWDLADATEARTIFGHEGFILAVAFGPDGTALASASEDHSVRLWETATGRPLASFLGHASHASALAFDPRGRWVASGGQAGEVKVWDLRRSRPVVHRIQIGWVTGVAFRGDGRRVASEIDPSRMGDAGGVVETKFWDPDTGEEDAPSAGMTSGPGSGYGSFGRLEELNAISPDGRWSARPGGPNEIRVTDTMTGRGYSLVGHTNRVTCAAFSPDGSRIVTTSWDRTIKLWDAATGRELLTLRGHTGGVLCAVFSPDGHRLASGSNDKTARVWDARPLRTDSP